MCDDGPKVQETVAQRTERLFNEGKDISEHFNKEQAQHALYELWATSQIDDVDPRLIEQLRNAS